MIVIQFHGISDANVEDFRTQVHILLLERATNIDHILVDVSQNLLMHLGDEPADQNSSRFFMVWADEDDRMGAVFEALGEFHIPILTQQEPPRA